APEQHAGTIADARADQFSFCVALFEALYGFRPHAGETLAQLAHAVTTGSRRDAPAGSGVPRAGDAAIARGLATRPEDRHRSMVELIAALERASTRRRPR